MNCEGTVDLLSAYIDDELAAEERQHVASHLGDCPNCQAQLTKLKNAVELVRGLDDLDVPAGVERALRQIVEDKPTGTSLAKRWLAMPKLRYLVATGAVAAIALVSLFSLTDTGKLDDKVAVKRAPSKYESKPGQGGPTDEYTYSQEMKEKNALLDHTVGPKGLAETHGATDYSGAAGSGQEEAYRHYEKALSTSVDEPWPTVLISRKDYDAASAGVLLDDIHKKTDGLYSVKDAGDRRVQTVNALLEKVTEQGGEGELLRDPINALLDRIKHAALPVYLEKAKFKKQDCWLIIIKWGLGDDKSVLRKTSLYVTDLSGWNIIHSASR
ncbi:MAG: zf-HC2 domain-containing protein [Actinobacteria bacterium]|nr:zf-HC2 domain-containing protein [Actinomycetota bacterium]